MWKQKNLRPSHSSQESDTLLTSPNLSTEGSSISSEFGNLSLGQLGSDAEEVFGFAGSPTKERTPEVGAISTSSRDSKKGGNGDTRHVMIEVQPGDFKKTVKKRTKHGHDRSAVSISSIPLHTIAFIPKCTF